MSPLGPVKRLSTGHVNDTVPLSSKGNQAHQHEVGLTPLAWWQGGPRVASVLSVQIESVTFRAVHDEQGRGRRVPRYRSGACFARRMVFADGVAAVAVFTTYTAEDTQMAPGDTNIGSRPHNVTSALD